MTKNDIDKIIRQNHFVEFYNWHQRDFAAPSPRFIKNAVLSRHSIPGCIWYESGSYRYETTRFLASLNVSKVYTCEPSPQFFEEGYVSVAGNSKIIAVREESTVFMRRVLAEIESMQPLCLFLDGHYSPWE